MGRIATRHSSKSHGKARLKSAPRFLVRVIGVDLGPILTQHAMLANVGVGSSLCGNARFDRVTPITGVEMKRFIEGEDRQHATLFPDSLEGYVTEDNPVRIIDAFIDELDLQALGFAGAVPEVTGRPAYHPATPLKIYLYGYLNRVQSSRRLERANGRLDPLAPRLSGQYLVQQDCADFYMLAVHVREPAVVGPGRSTA